MIGRLKKAYNNKDYELFLILFNKYISLGYGVNIYLVIMYLNSLIGLKYYDKAYDIIKKYEEKGHLYDKELKRLYLRCYKPEDVIRISIDKEDVLSYFYTIAAYMLMGNIEEAKKLIDEAIKLDEGYKVEDFSKKIYNFEYRNASLETEYNCFINNGNKLEEGHIIYLKRPPKFNYNIINDEKAFNRPYMIWKIEDNKLYLFPLTSKCKDNFYKLYMQKYPNSKYDRGVKPNACITTKDNVLSVADKVLEEDYNNLLANIYYSIYFATLNGNTDFKYSNKEFINSYFKEIEKYDVLEYVENDDRKFYLVLDFLSSKYKVVEIDFPNKKIIGLKEKTIYKDKLIYKVFILSEEDKYVYRGQLHNLYINNDKLEGKIVTINNISYIVVKEKEDFCLCVNCLYSDSYIDSMVVHKDDIECIIGEIDEDTKENIENLLAYNQINVAHRLKKANKKKLSRF